MRLALLAVQFCPDVIQVPLSRLMQEAGVDGGFCSLWLLLNDVEEDALVTTFLAATRVLGRRYLLLDVNLSIKWLPSFGAKNFSFIREVCESALLLGSHALLY